MTMDRCAETASDGIVYSRVHGKNYTVLVEVGAKGKVNKGSATEEGREEEEGGQRRYEYERGINVKRTKIDDDKTIQWERYWGARAEGLFPAPHQTSGTVTPRCLRRRLELIFHGGWQVPLWPTGGDSSVGTPYHGEWTMYTGKWKDVLVRMFKGAQSNMYYVIRATPPADWNTSTKDVTDAGFATTLGPASFFEPMQNKLDLNQLHSMVHAGQPRKVLSAVQERTKKRGRPRKALSTHKAVDRILHIPQCRIKDRAIHTVNKENDNGAVRPESISKPGYLTFRLPMWAQDHAGRVDEAIMNTKVFRIGAMTSYSGTRE
ncbi:hypothetical protein B0H14DRAFT_2564289 [Mycena olivaceomarginata]|nr:hypothetical protein B0H14DRAFT_2564289 [Mycena olivaceomarginata]